MKLPVIYRTIEDLASDNKLWYQYAYKIAKKKELADDMVSDMYLIMLLLNQKNPNKTFSKSYIYTTLKNLHLKAKANLKKEIIIDRNITCEYIPDEEVETIEDEIDALDFTNYTMEYLSDDNCKQKWFHNTIFKYVIIDGIAIRELERRSNIHFNILQHSIKTTKKKLIENYKPKNE